MHVGIQSIVASVAFISACSAPAIAFAALPIEACSLLTPAQVSGVLGVPVKSGERLVPNSATRCGFGEPGGKHVVVAILKPEIFANEKHPLEGVKENLAAGLGDDAHYMTTPGFGTGLSVKKGDFVFKVRVYGFPAAQVEAKEKDLARQILAGL